MNYGTHMTKEGRFAHCKTLSDLVKEYNKHFKEKFDGTYHAGSERSVGHHDPVIDVCKEAKSFKEAIVKAVAGRTKNGKMFSEGTCVRRESKKLFENNLTKLNIYDKLRRARDFEDIYDIVRLNRPWGIGNCTTYNVAVRIAAYKGISPEKFLYLHAGPLEGWKRLTGSRSNPYRVPIEEIPEPLRVLSMHSLEDMLCEMREALKPEMLS